VTETRLFLDTNVFLRFLTADQEKMAEDCRRLFERAEDGEFQLHISHLALAEIVWTLQSYYRVPRAGLAAMLRDLLALRSLRVDQKEMLLEVVDLYASTNVDFIDAYHALEVRRRGIDRICSYDRDFDSLHVARVEPAGV
jgi:uncharacterized protein